MLLNSRNRLHNRKLNSLHNNEVNSLPKIKDRTYLTKLDEYKSIGTSCITLYVTDNKVTCFDDFKVKYIPLKLLKSV